MKKIIFTILAIVLIASLFTACKRQVAEPSSPSATEPTLEPESETNDYIDSQFVDPEEDIDIGEMI
ncbi:hypothetical protein JW930_07740 [Candidatus Woesearchaeota archaeon]|nr:hypothetical protein [Candidatus Woesearchaeota archaeon]